MFSDETPPSLFVNPHLLTKISLTSEFPLYLQLSLLWERSQC